MSIFGRYASANSGPKYIGPVYEIDFSQPQKFSDPKSDLKVAETKLQSSSTSGLVAPLPVIDDSPSAYFSSSSQESCKTSTPVPLAPPPPPEFDESLSFEQVLFG